MHCPRGTAGVISILKAQPGALNNIHKVDFILNSLPARANFIIYCYPNANKLDPDQVQQNVGLNLYQNCFTLQIISWKIFLKKKRNQQMTRKLSKE